LPAGSGRRVFLYPVITHTPVVAAKIYPAAAKRAMAVAMSIPPAGISKRRRPAMAGGRSPNTGIREELQSNTFPPPPGGSAAAALPTPIPTITPKP
jgi:hypothetical protein